MFCTAYVDVFLLCLWVGSEEGRIHWALFLVLLMFALSTVLKILESLRPTNRIVSNSVVLE